jgi:acyl-CoA synthetase (AMP-forming)/AMP-acid ligase II
MKTSVEGIPAVEYSCTWDIEHETLSTLLTRWANEIGDQAAITHLDYQASPDGLATTVTWRELDRRADAVAAWLRGRTEPGDRAAVLAPQRIEYIVAFLGIIRAGLVAVPLFGPDLPGHADRLAAVLRDCAPSTVLTAGDTMGSVESFLAGRDLDVAHVAAVDTLPDADRVPAVHTGPDDLAYLQYTSGSTRTPAGVMITHRNLLSNAVQSMTAYGHSVTVSWLPLFHDMGLMLGLIAPVAGGFRGVLLDPVAFLERPVRWLRALSSNPGAISAAPSFAYAYTASRVAERDKIRLRLDHVVSLIDGSEPVQPDAIDRFHAAFAECGLKPEVHRVSYGLAEATVLVAASPAGAPPARVAVDRTRLAGGHAMPATADSAASTLVSCGHAIGQRVLIVDPHRDEVLPAGQVGEIWVSGDNVATGYWNRREESARTFGAVPRDTGDQVPTEAMSRRWLRTGDLGVLYGGELYVTGRIKDLIIVDGRNHYPQDVEETVELAHPAIRRHSAAAFSVAINGGEAGESAVVLAERAKHVAESELDVTELREAVIAAVATRHGLRVHDLILLEPGAVPRTSSGKISRAASRQRYLGGGLSGSPVR